MKYNIVITQIKFAEVEAPSEEAAIKVVQDGVDAIDLRVDKLEALSATTSSAVQTIEISGITGVSATKVGTKYTIDFTNMVIDGGSF
jgi:3-dehydroquinate dehydratase